MSKIILFFILFVFLTIIVSGVSAREDCWDPVKGHCYPRIGFFMFGKATPEWTAEFDYVITAHYSSSYPLEVKSISPHTYVIGTTDWNYGSVLLQSGESFPEEWFVRKSDGTKFKIYGDRYHLIDQSDFCPKSTAFGGKRYNEIIADRMQWRFDLTAFDGVGTDGVWETPGWGKDYDLDDNGVKDWNEHDYAWIENVWNTNGVMKAVRELRNDIGDDKIIYMNSLRFHGFSWQETNGLYLEHQHGMTKGGYWHNFKNYMTWFDQWMTIAPEPHTILYGANRGQSRDDYTYMRFSLGAAMYGDAYVEVTDKTSREHMFISYYDEYDINLGYPTGPMELLYDTEGVDGEGVWVRFFDNGAYILNMDSKSNTVTDNQLKSMQGYNGPYYRFKGGQDPDFNNGELFDFVILSGRSETHIDDGRPSSIGDGIMLTKNPAVSISDIIIDNEAQFTSPGSDGANFHGTWIREKGNPEFWTPGYNCEQGNCGYRAASSSSYTTHADFIPTIGVAGDYEVYEWHGPRSGASQNVVFEISHANGKDTKTIDQTKNTVHWNLIGTYRFNKGGNGFVRINTMGSNGDVIADAIKFVYKNEPSLSCSDQNGFICSESQVCTDNFIEANDTER
ncbi:MAG: hypothetical protein JW716_06020, partial [Candidatus Aenigmarchaeota archaeon]|nr:hypothetical protein [Candidatus Aenigmarchaeota archaeon]